MTRIEIALDDRREFYPLVIPGIAKR